MGLVFSLHHLKSNFQMEEILKKLSVNLESNDEVDMIFGNPKIFPTKLVEKLSIQTALKYLRNEISFLEGDYIMNNIYGFWLINFSKDYGFSEIAWECYEAFDSGEYCRSEDDPNLDPAEIYTKPLLEEFVTKYKKLKPK